jgi:hypothetical protein
MNMPKELSVAYAVRSRILRAGGDRLWAYRDFPTENRVAVSAALSRLARTGLIARVRPGVYYRPRRTVLGPSRPDPEVVLDAVLRLRGAEPVPSGISEYSRLGLTTQASGSITRAVPRRMNHAILSEFPVYLSARPLERQRGIRSEERTALDALRDLGRIPGSTPRDVIGRIATLIRAGKLSFSRLARFARVEPPRVRALLGAIGEDVRSEGARGGAAVLKENLERLRSSLNPLSSYRVPGAREVLASAASWRIW